MVAYACSTIITGLVFLFLGLFKLGNLIQFFPRHILIGCIGLSFILLTIIGGIGVFLILTGIEVTCDIQPELSLESLYAIFRPHELKLWGTGLACAIFLNIIQKMFKNPFLLPIFFCVIPIIFYCIVLVSGVTMQELREMGWLFTLPSATDSPFWLFWTYYDFNVVDWSAIAKTLPTQFALTFFGILHVPINGN
jgi:MFS superfamily sulfate permease-like transporter